MLKEKIWNYGEYQSTDYIDTEVLPSGQTIKIEFQEEWTNRYYLYNVYLVIMNKRKSENQTQLKSMGKDGIKGLLWAKNKIQEFEKFIKEKHGDNMSVIFCHWDDNRRRNAYHYGLSKIGYKYGFIGGKKVLLKTI